jgi:hypothetical protein
MVFAARGNAVHLAGPTIRTPAVRPEHWSHLVRENPGLKPGAARRHRRNIGNPAFGGLRIAAFQVDTKARAFRLVLAEVGEAPGFSPGVCKTRRLQAFQPGFLTKRPVHGREAADRHPAREGRDPTRRSPRDGVACLHRA